MFPLFRVFPVVLTTLWAISDWFVQMTVLPTGIVTVLGLKPEFWMAIDFVTGFGAGVGVGVGRGVGVALGVGVGRGVGVAVGARAVVAVGLTWTAGCEGDVFDDEPLRLPSATMTP